MKKNQYPLEKKLDVFLILVALFLVKGLFNILVRDFEIWLIIDYLLVKVIPIWLILYLIHKKKYLKYSDIGFAKIGFTKIVILTIIFTVIGTAIDQIGWQLWPLILPTYKLGGIPFNFDSWLFTFDLYFGLIFVAIVEEVVFRGLGFAALKERINSYPVIFIILSLTFGLIHWSWGSHAIINTSIMGAIFLVCVWRTGNIIPLIIAHYLVNLFGISGYNFFGFLFN